MVQKSGTHARSATVRGDAVPNLGLVSLPFVTSQSADFKALFDILRAFCDGNKVTEVSEIIGKKHLSSELIHSMGPFKEAFH